MVARAETDEGIECMVGRRRRPPWVYCEELTANFTNRQ